MNREPAALAHPRPGAAASDAIVAHGVTKVFDLDGSDLRALDDVSFRVGDGEFCSLIGPSGCGKSTLLRLVAGLVAPTSGTIVVDGETPAAARAARRLGMVFQDAVLLPWRSAIGNVELPLEVAGVGSKDERRRRAGALLDLVGLGEFKQAQPTTLSGGMARRVAIARALVLEPDILLLDEPFGALDEITRQRMNVELQRIWAAARRTAVLVTHNVGEAVFLSDRVVVMAARPGRIIAERTIDLPRPRTLDVLNDPRFFDYTRDLSTLLLSDGAEGEVV